MLRTKVDKEIFNSLKVQRQRKKSHDERFLHDKKATENSLTFCVLSACDIFEIETTIYTLSSVFCCELFSLTYSLLSISQHSTRSPISSIYFKNAKSLHRSGDDVEETLRGEKCRYETRNINFSRGKNCSHKYSVAARWVGSRGKCRRSDCEWFSVVSGAFFFHKWQKFVYFSTWK